MTMKLDSLMKEGQTRTDFKKWSLTGCGLIWSDMISNSPDFHWPDGKCENDALAWTDTCLHLNWEQLISAHRSGGLIDSDWSVFVAVSRCEKAHKGRPVSTWTITASPVCGWVAAPAQSEADVFTSIFMTTSVCVSALFTEPWMLSVFSLMLVFV